MGICLSTMKQGEYTITHHRYLACLQSILPVTDHSFLSVIEEDIGTDIDALYQRLIHGQTRITTSFPLNAIEVYMYAGVIGLHYGPHSPQFQTITDSLVTYSNVDMYWLGVAVEGLYTSVTQPVAYQTSFSARDVLTIPNTCSILILSDFATGLRRSEVVLQEARRLCPTAHLVIHGGDTYYSGSRKEQETNLIQPLKTYFPHAMIRCLRGNHDLYSGPEGFAYVQESIQQPSTYFSVSNDYFLIQGMDTSLYDPNPLQEGKVMVSLLPAEAKWHSDRIQHATQQGKKVLVMSHHEPLTWNDSVGVYKGKSPAVNMELYRQLEEVIPSIDAYYFGHQHGFMLYQDYTYRNGPTLKKPRLIGHGGCPVMSNQTLETLYTPPTTPYDTSMMDVPQLVQGPDWRLRHNGSVIDTGFVMMTCDKDQIRADYYTIHSTALDVYEQAVCVYSETL